MLYAAKVQFTITPRHYDNIVAGNVVQSTGNVREREIERERGCGFSQGTVVLWLSDVHDNDIANTVTSRYQEIFIQQKDEETKLRKLMNVSFVFLYNFRSDMAL